MKGARSLAVLGVALAFALVTPFVAHTQRDASDGDLAAAVQRLVDAASLGEKVGIEIRDASTQRVVYQLRADVPLNPASNMKVVTAAAALLTLGPERTFRTSLSGRVEDGAVSDLVLAGQGDPTLDEADVFALAEALADRGVRSVERIHVDGSYFDDRLLPPAFEQQPNEVAAFRAAVAAVSVDRSAYVLRVLPGPSEGARAVVRLHGEGYFDVQNEITTTAGGAPNVIAAQSVVGDRMSLRLTGTMPLGLLGVSYRRRIENPLAHAGHLLAEALGHVGIRGARAVRVGAFQTAVPLLVEHESKPLAQILAEVGKHSDNYVAEMILKALGAERARPGTSANGVAVLHDVLRQAGVPAGAASIVNGSGLFRGNAIAASHLARVLAFVYRTPSIRSEYLSQLAIGGVDGTLARRLTESGVPRVVRAKTGTLNDVIALSGFVLGRDANRAYAFSILANGVGGKQAEARALADAIVVEMVRALHPSR